MLTAVIVIEGRSRAALAAAIREIAKDIELGTSNAAGGFGPESCQCDGNYQVTAGAGKNEIVDALIGHYRGYPARVVDNFNASRDEEP